MLTMNWNTPATQSSPSLSGAGQLWYSERKARRWPFIYTTGISSSSIGGFATVSKMSKAPQGVSTLPIGPGTSPSISQVDSLQANSNASALQGSKSFSLPHCLCTPRMPLPTRSFTMLRNHSQPQHRHADQRKEQMTILPSNQSKNPRTANPSQTAAGSPLAKQLQALRFNFPTSTQTRKEISLKIL